MLLDLWKTDPCVETRVPELNLTSSDNHALDVISDEWETRGS